MPSWDVRDRRGLNVDVRISLEIVSEVYMCWHEMHTLFESSLMAPVSRLLLQLLRWTPQVMPMDMEMRPARLSLQVRLSEGHSEEPKIIPLPISPKIATELHIQMSCSKPSTHPTRSLSPILAISLPISSLSS